MAVATTTSRDTFIGNGVTRLFALDYVFQDASSLSVTLVNNTTLAVTNYVLGVDYTVLGGAGLTGSISSSSAHSASFTLVADRVEPTLQAQVYAKYGKFPAKVVEAGFDRLVYQTQRLTASISRTLRQPDADLTNIATIPNKVNRAGMYLTFNATTGDPECINSVASVSAIAGISAQIVVVAGISASVSLVAGISAQVVTVAGISASVTTVAGISASVSLVAGISASVSLVAGVSASVSLVAGISAAVSAVAGISASVSLVAGISANVSLVAGISANVTTVAGISASVVAVAGISASVSLVSGISANVTTVAGISASVSLVAGISASVSLVSGISANVTTVAGISSQVVTVAGISAQIISAALNNTNTNNFIHNGDMSIDQRREGGANTIPGGPASPIVDRWFAVFTSGGGASITLQRVSDAPPGFMYSSKITVAISSGTSAADLLRIRQGVEGVDALALNMGTSAAPALTLSMYIKSSISGIFTLNIANSAADRRYLSTISVTASETAVWKQVSLSTTSGDAAGSWLIGTGQSGLLASLILMCGTTNQSTSMNAWVSGSAQGSASQTQLTGTSGATFQFTGVKLETGAAVTSFVRRQYGDELRLCQRFFCKTFLQGVSVAQSAGISGAITVKNPVALGDPSEFWQFPVTMAGIPTITTYNPSASNANWRDITAAGDATVSVDPATTIGDGGVLIATSGTVATLGDILAIHATAAYSTF